MNESHRSGLAAVAVRDGDDVTAFGALAGSTRTGWELRRNFASRRPRRSSPDEAPLGGPHSLIVVAGRIDAALAGTTVDVHGRLHDSYLEVTRMTLRPRRTILDLPRHPPPCPPPPGGWLSPDGTSDLHLPDTMSELVAARPNEFNELWITYDHDGPHYPNAEGGTSPVPVVAVGTTGNVERAHRELAALYPGPICVYPISASRRELDAIDDELRAHFADRFITAPGRALDAPDRAHAVVTRVTVEDVAALAGRDHLIHVEPRIRPIRA